MGVETVNEILKGTRFDRDNILALLSAEGEEKLALYERANQIKNENVGDKVYFRGLIELSNICAKNCFYCGIRKDNANFERYNLNDDEVIEAAKFAHINKFASLVIQSGELSGKVFTSRVTKLLEKIHASTQGELRITLSMGEQPEDTYRNWFNAGAHRYLLRIETTNPTLYRKMHPRDRLHSLGNRIKCLHSLKQLGYQVGSGVMIGLPFQTRKDLAGDLLFLQDFGIDMVGMGPYIEHSDTPLYQYKNALLPLDERFRLSLKMIAVLRVLMPKINIASSTALQAIDKLGREKALKVGANVIMPNITPGQYRNDYKLYENKPCTDDSAEDCKNCLEARVALSGNRIGYGEWGDSVEFICRNHH
jgi:biotin synthase